jgi:hypothetical protein
MHTYTYKYMFPYVLIDSLTLSHTNPWNVSTCGPSRRHKRSRIHAHTISHVSIHVLYIIMGFHGCLTCLLKDAIPFHTCLCMACSCSLLFLATKDHGRAQCFRHAHGMPHVSMVLSNPIWLHTCSLISTPSHPLRTC